MASAELSRIAQKLLRAKPVATNTPTGGTSYFTAPRRAKCLSRFCRLIRCKKRFTYAELNTGGGTKSKFVSVPETCWRLNLARVRSAKRGAAGCAPAR